MLPAIPDVEGHPADRATADDPLDSSLRPTSPKIAALPEKREPLHATENGLESDNSDETNFLQFYF